jgi:hypothetical protein
MRLPIILSLSLGTSAIALAETTIDAPDVSIFASAEHPGLQTVEITYKRCVTTFDVSYGKLKKDLESDATMLTSMINLAKEHKKTGCK